TVYGLVLSGNVVSANTTVNGPAIYLADAYAGNLPTTVAQNRLAGGWAFGVDVAASSTTVRIVGNVFANFTNKAIELANSTRPTEILSNTFASNATTRYQTLYGVYVNSGTSGQSQGPIVFDSNQFVGGIAVGLYMAVSGSGFTAAGNTILNVTFAAIELDVEYGNVAISNNTVVAESPNAKVYGTYLSTVYGNVTFDNNRVTGGALYGLDLQFATGQLVVSGNQIVDPTLVGMRLNDAWGGAQIFGNDVRGNNSTWMANADGIEAYAVGGGAGLFLSNNTVGGGFAKGILLEYPWSSRNIVSGNHVYQTLDCGLCLNDFNAPYAPTELVGNTVVASAGSAIQAISPANLTVAGNDLPNASVALNVSGIYGPVLIEGNNATGSAISLELAQGTGTGYATVVGNNFTDSGAAYTNGTVASFAGNDFRGTSLVAFFNDNLTAFYHNDLTSSSFRQSSTILSGTWNAVYPLGGNYWTGYTGIDHYSGPGQNISGADGIGDTPYTIDNASDAYPLMHPWISASVSFEESGLPSGQSWSVTFNGETMTAIAGEMLSFAQVNGANTAFSYLIGWADNTYAPASRSGSGVENGSNQVVSVVFAPVLWTVTFSQSTLPSGTNWSVDLNGTAHFSTGSSLTFEEMNGSYAYTVEPVVDFTVASSTATVVVTGASTSVVVAFALYTYPVVFQEQGLPSGTHWYVNFTAHPAALNPTNISTTLSHVTISLVNGTFSITRQVGSADYFPVSGLVQTFTSSPSLGVTIEFAAPTSAVTFTESGLPSSAEWYVNVTGQPPSGGIASGGSSYVANLPNGTYTFTASTNNPAIQATGGSFSVSGHNVSQSVTFVPVQRSVMFVESGLPSGSNWSVSLNGSAPQFSTGTTIAVAERVGTYTYTVTVPSGYLVTPPRGSVTVDGTNTTFYVVVTSAASVSLPPSPSSSGGVSPGIFYAVLGGLVVAAVLALLGWFLYFRRRPMGSSATTPSTPKGGG
ncbi:MAG: right-handed parallel beta-helix repeat-containing protein, partial [Thermoplasmata archaeon]